MQPPYIFVIRLVSKEPRRTTLKCSPLPPPDSLQQELLGASCPSFLGPARRARRGACRWSRTWPRQVDRPDSEQTAGPAAGVQWRSMPLREHKDTTPRDLRLQVPAADLHYCSPNDRKWKIVSDDSWHEQWHSFYFVYCVSLEHSAGRKIWLAASVHSET